MDDSSSPHSSEQGFWTSIFSLFKHKNGTSLEDSVRGVLSEGEMTGEDMKMVLNILSLEDTLVNEIMIPRTDIVCSDVDDGIAGVIELIIEHGHSRIPIYRDDKDNMIGIVHAKDLLQVSQCVEEASLEVRDYMRPPLFIPENKNVRDMLHEFRKRKIHLAIAVDEYGGTSGLITLEDILEEIVGEIHDEHDTEGPAEIQEQPDGTLLISGRLYLEELNEYMKTNLESEQVETIGGYLCELSGRVPRQGEFFTLEGARFLVKEADKKQIRWIHVQPAQNDD